MVAMNTVQLSELPYLVVYGRYGVTHRRLFSTLKELAEWVERSEDRDEIWAAAVSRHGETIFEHEHPPSKKRWIQLDPNTPWPGKHS